MTYAVIRVRGTVNIHPDIKHTLKLLNLSKINHCILLEEKPSAKGMIQVAKDYITWGEIDKDVLSKLISTRGRLEGDKNLTNDYIKSSTSYDSIERLSQAIIENKFRYKDIPNVKPIFRLSPPKKGYEGIKRSVSNKGALGYRKKDINKLIERMI
ncbi:50S ribosomal protein L30 [Thermoplasmatales archaeon SG8-52-4]|nr:MAG: 50S ribosomal protein L30 [Thermoplasmatales archaeon SG8-52-4]